MKYSRSRSHTVLAVVALAAACELGEGERTTLAHRTITTLPLGSITLTIDADLTRTSSPFRITASGGGRGSLPDGCERPRTHDVVRVLLAARDANGPISVENPRARVLPPNELGWMSLDDAPRARREYERLIVDGCVDETRGLAAFRTRFVSEPNAGTKPFRRLERVATGLRWLVPDVEASSCADALAMP